MKVETTSGGYVNYKDVKLKKFSGTAKIGNCEKWIATILGIPIEAVNLVLPSGRRAKSTSNLSRLRKT